MFSPSLVSLSLMVYIHSHGKQIQISTSCCIFLKVTCNTGARVRTPSGNKTYYRGVSISYEIRISTGMILDSYAAKHKCTWYSLSLHRFPNELIHSFKEPWECQQRITWHNFFSHFYFRFCLINHVAQPTQREYLLHHWKWMTLIMPCERIAAASITIKLNGLKQEKESCP